MAEGVLPSGPSGRNEGDDRPRSRASASGAAAGGGRHPGGHSRKIPAFEGRCIPAGFFALPHRTASGTPRLGASPVGAHRPSRCTASSATDPGTPGGAFRGGRSSADVRVHCTSSDEAKTPSEAAEPARAPKPGASGGRCGWRSRAFATRKPPTEPPGTGSHEGGLPPGHV
jgi:hypothetical protein